MPKQYTYVIVRCSSKIAGDFCMSTPRVHRVMKQKRHSEEYQKLLAEDRKMPSDPQNSQVISEQPSLLGDFACGFSQPFLAPFRAIGAAGKAIKDAYNN